MLTKYQCNKRVKSHDLPPHVYSIADKAYRQMMDLSNEIHQYSQRKVKNQSILISGESGAGKTETTKIVMHYLTNMGLEAKATIMERVLQSNPILEAFGNAKTARNENSSRFGKYIELGFDDKGVLQGAYIRTYLLEKVRTGSHAQGERNYHIFYQALRGMSHNERLTHLGFDEIWEQENPSLIGKDYASVLHYTGQGGATELSRSIDQNAYKQTLLAMDSLGWTSEKAHKVFKILGGLLHLGEVSFETIANSDNEAAFKNESVVGRSSDLLGVEFNKLKKALLEKHMVMRGETINMKLTSVSANASRDAISKIIYGALFSWIVSQVNRSIGWKDTPSSTIGVLDIFGFESLKENSLEQLCINFANEALQQQFNKFIFKAQLAEYHSEGISGGSVQFPDNQDCLDTIQARPNGILPMLDDECKLPKGSEANWVERMYKIWRPDGKDEKSIPNRFGGTNLQRSKCIFCINHFAGYVAYSACSGFLEKNKDEVPITARDMFLTSPNALLREIFELSELNSTIGASYTPSKKAKMKSERTLGFQFKEQLGSLMDKISLTEPHYIRCLKPNDNGKPKIFNRRRVTEQLRCGGVLEAMRVTRIGYPVRMTHEFFISRYRKIVLSSAPNFNIPWKVSDSNTGKDDCQKLVNALRCSFLDQDVTCKTYNLSEKELQVGTSKVFIRSEAHSFLESRLSRLVFKSAAFLQSIMRAYLRRVGFELIKRAGRTMTKFGRNVLQRYKYQRQKIFAASVVITKNCRSYLYLSRYHRELKDVRLLQKWFRVIKMRTKKQASDPTIRSYASKEPQKNEFVLNQVTNSTAGTTISAPQYTSLSIDNHSDIQSNVYSPPDLTMTPVNYSIGSSLESTSTLSSVLRRRGKRHRKWDSIPLKFIEFRHEPNNPENVMKDVAKVYDLLAREKDCRRSALYFLITTCLLMVALATLGFAFYQRTTIRLKLLSLYLEALGQGINLMDESFFIPYDNFDFDFFYP